MKCKQCHKTNTLKTESLMDDLQGILTCNYCGHKQSLLEKTVTEPQHLYTPTDVKKVRQKLYEEQGGLDLLTGLPVDFKGTVTDHDHKTQFVRGVIDRHANMALGKIEGIYTRYLSHSYPHSLTDFLECVIEYLNRPVDTRYLHHGWIKKVNTLFNQLNESQKKLVLKELGQPEGTNSTERKKLFKKAVMTRQFGFEQIKQIINQTKGGS